MVILGIDPGTIVTGFGVVEFRNGGLKILTSGTIRNSSADPIPGRLMKIFRGLDEAIHRFQPGEVAIETSFYGKNAQSALKLGQARGVAVLATVLRGLEPAEYAPREVKKAVTGSGNASKRQVQYMVKSLLKLKNPAPGQDASDALAVAICHSRRIAEGKRKYPVGANRAGRPIPSGRSDWATFVKENPDKLHRTRSPKDRRA